MDIKGEVAGTVVMSGEANCQDDALLVTTEVIPNDHFTPTSTIESSTTGNAICNGDVVSADALDPSQLPKYMIGLVFDNPLD